jgi:class 3 adenylate cyclase
VNDLVAAVLRLGADQHDDEDLRLRKVLLLSAAVMIVPAALVWGVAYWAFGVPLAAAVPWAYVVVSVLGVVALAVTRRYHWFAVSQFAAWITLPFVLMWVLGGFVTGSVVALWACVAPLGARIIGHRRAAVSLLVLFALGFLASAIAQPGLVPQARLPDIVVVAFFVLNVVGVGAITLALLDASAGGREGSLVAMRAIVRRYFSPDVAAAIVTDPARQELGGEIVDVTVLFADLGGYSTYAAERDPTEVVDLLNALFGAAVPPILAEGGTPVQIPGDAVMAIFGAPRRAPHHAHRAARAALSIQERSGALLREHPSWPQFRIGLNSGETLVGNIGTDDFRSFTAIGDTTNMAQRFQTLAEAGQVVVGPHTASLLTGADLTPLGPVLVKGRSEPIEPYVLVSLDEAIGPGRDVASSARLGTG